MDVFYNFFIPAISIVFITMLPIYFLRMYYFIRKSHFVDEIVSLRISLYIHIATFAIFSITLIFFAKYIDVLVYYIFGLTMIVFLFLLIGYRQKFLHQKRNKFVVLFSKYNNRQAFQDFLDEMKYSEVDISDGSFSYVTKIKFNNCSTEQIVNRFKEIEKTELLYSYQSVKGYLLFALHTGMTFASVTAFVIFFVFLPRLGL